MTLYLILYTELGSLSHVQKTIEGVWFIRCKSIPVKADIRAIDGCACGGILSHCLVVEDEMPLSHGEQSRDYLRDSVQSSLQA
jgi:hypothetical protein